MNKNNVKCGKCEVVVKGSFFVSNLGTIYCAECGDNKLSYNDSLCLFLLNKDNREVISDDSISDLELFYQNEWKRS